MPSRRRVLQNGAALGGLALVGIPLAGCGEEETKTPGGVDLSMQAAWVNDAEFIGYFVAIDKGFYLKEKIDFDYRSGGPSIVADHVLMQRNCDIALTTPDNTVSIITSKHAPIKFIGTQYQRSPLGIVTLKENNITEPGNLRGKRLAVPRPNIETTRKFLEINDVNPDDVTFMDYQYDPKPLVLGQVDATVDFVTNVPFSILLAGKKPHSFLFADWGFNLFMDTVAVFQETIDTKRDALVGFLRASRKGWEENFKDVTAYPDQFKNTWFKGNGRAIANEEFFNRRQEDLMESPQGIFAMSEEAIEENIKSLRSIGLMADRSMFVTDLLNEV